MKVKLPRWKIWNTSDPADSLNLVSQLQIQEKILVSQLQMQEKFEALHYFINQDIHFFIQPANQTPNAKAVSTLINATTHYFLQDPPAPGPSGKGFFSKEKIFLHDPPAFILHRALLI